MGSESSKEQKIDIVVLGPSESGKTTLIYKMTKNEGEPEPTDGFFYETFEYNDCRLNLLEMAGNHKNSLKWYRMMKKCQAIIYVIDSSDTHLLDFAREKLFLHLQNNVAKDAILLVYANKQDIQNAMDAKEIIQKYNLDTVKQNWHIQESNFLTGDGVFEGLDWIINQIPKSKN